MGYVHEIDLDDTQAVLETDWTPLREAKEIELRRELCRRAAAEYEAFHAPEAVEARRIRHEAAVEAELAVLRAELAREIARARAAELAREMTWDEMVEEFLS